MTGIWAVARQTFAQCLRTKVGGMFIILLAIALLVAPMLNNDPDIPLADRIRTFLSYSTGFATVLMCIVTVFLGAGVIASDVAGKQVFLLAVKPLARWQYIIGRWLGVVMLDALLLFMSGTAIYLIAQHLRVQDATSANDWLAVETEVFTARERIGPDMTKANAKIESETDKRIQRLSPSGYAAAVDAFRPQAGGNEQRARELLRQEFHRQIAATMESAGPGEPLNWSFKGVRVAGSERTGLGVVKEIDRQRGFILIQIQRDLLGLLLLDRPVRVGQADGRVVNIGPDSFIVQLQIADMTRGKIASLGKGGSVDIELDPVIQITYKATALKETKGGPLYSQWQIYRPPVRGDSSEGVAPELAGELYDVVNRTDAPGLPATMTVSARAVNPDGELQVVYFNKRRPSDGFGVSTSILPTDISVLYRVGSFEANFLRGLVMILVQLMFIAALSIFAGSFLGFPVASLAVFGILPCGLAQDWLRSAVDAMPPDVVGHISKFIVFGASMLVPNLDRLSPADSLVGGLRIPWDAASLGPVWYSLAGMALILGLACVIFHKRELARVQV